MSQKDFAIQFLKMASSGNIREAYDRFIAPDFIHHNQYFPGDRQSLLAGMESAAAKNPGKTCEIQQALEEGDKVMTLSHVRQHAEDSGVAVVHIFRFQNGKVVELWDVGQAVAKESPNKNGPFYFFSICELAPARNLL